MKKNFCLDLYQLMFSVLPWINILQFSSEQLKLDQQNQIFQNKNEKEYFSYWNSKPCNAAGISTGNKTLKKFIEFFFKKLFFNTHKTFSFIHCYRKKSKLENISYRIIRRPLGWIDFIECYQRSTMYTYKNLKNYQINYLNVLLIIEKDDQFFLFSIFCRVVWVNQSELQIRSLQNLSFQWNSSSYLQASYFELCK